MIPFDHFVKEEFCTCCSVPEMRIWSILLSTSPPKNHAVLYIRAIYRMSQISNFFSWSASF